jgi:hypothetical protein
MTLSIAKRLWLKNKTGERCIEETKVTGAIKNSEKILSHCRFIYCNSHMGWSGIEPGLWQ